MKVKFFAVKKRVLFAMLCFCLCLVVVGACFAVSVTTSPLPIHTIVIDAGHGGKDGGAEGKTTGVDESKLNLDYALTLKEICEQFGFKVVLTRKDMGGLYSPFAENKKKSEMQKRKEIIEKTNPDLVVSIHMNSFPSSSAKGAQVFYAEGNDAGQSLADSVAVSLSKNIENAKETAKVGDYFVLNCTSIPAILIECGFLSNAEEEVLLQDENYMHNFCYQILCGVLLFFSQN